MSVQCSGIWDWCVECQGLNRMQADRMLYGLRLMHALTCAHAVQNPSTLLTGEAGGYASSQIIVRGLSRACFASQCLRLLHSS